MGPGREGIVIPIAHLKFVVFARQLSQPGATEFRPSRAPTNPQTTHIPTTSRHYPKYWAPGGEVSRALSLPTRSSNDRGLDLESHYFERAREGTPGVTGTNSLVFRYLETQMDGRWYHLEESERLEAWAGPLIWYNKTRPPPRKWYLHYLDM